MTATELLNLIGVIGTLGSVLFVLVTIYWTVRGLIPPLIRLGYGLRRKRIAIVALEQRGAELERLIQSSRLFNKKRIEIVDPNSEFEQLSKANVILVYFGDCQENIGDILNQKSADAALIVYAPPPERVSPEIMAQLAARKHVLLCNFRGRLMNDILTSMMTVAYDKG